MDEHLLDSCKVSCVLSLISQGMVNCIFTKPDWEKSLNCVTPHPNYRPVSKRKYVFLMLKGTWGQPSMNSEGSRSMVLNRSQLFIKVFSHLKRKKQPRFVCAGLQMRKSLCVSGHLFTATGLFPVRSSRERSCCDTLRRPTFGQLPCSPAGPQSCR